jgi:hypothetical protein
MSEQAITALADQLVTIFASGSRDAGTAVPGELDDAAADLLFPPRRWDEIERRDEALAAAAPRLGDYTLEELHRELFGDSVIESNRGADAAAAPGHVQFFGRHIHEHAAYDGHAGRHTHSHTHEGDGSHDHAHP